jgi:hypothetical protein
MIQILLLALQDLSVSSDFPGGSARVESVDAARGVRVLPAAHEGRGWTCWWYLRIDGAKAGETLVLDVGGGVWATPDRAVFSADDQDWIQTPPGKREKDRIRYEIRVPSATFWAAWGPPFTLKHARETVERAAAACPAAKVFELCRSREGRSVPALRVREGEPRGAIWIQARQHAWESGGSWVGRGFAEWLVSDAPRAAALRKAAEIVYVPVMDVDNVERGAGGKNQSPQDHNRDWSDDPHWPEVAAAQRGIHELAKAGRFEVFVDLHNPGASDKSPFFFITPRTELSEEARANVDLFLAAGTAEISGPLKLAGAPRESGKAYDPKNWQRISKNWVSAKAGPRAVAVTLETAWNTPHSTAGNYLRVGRELGLAIERYLGDPARLSAAAR